VLAAIAQRGHEVRAVGLDGLVATSKDHGQHFAVTQREDRASLTAALASDGGKWLTWSRRGLAK